MLSDANNIAVSKINDLQVELTNANVIFKCLNIGSKQLEDILDAQRPTGDKTSLSFHGASSSIQTGGKVIEMESGKVISKTCTKDTVNYRVKKPSETIQSKINEFVPICQYCQVRGHFRPKCFQLHGHPTVTQFNTPHVGSS